MAAVHEVNKPFKFNICEPNFSQKRNLNRHISVIHEVIQTFIQKGNLNEHKSTIHEVIQSLPKKEDRMDIVVHEGKKPSSYKICDM